MSADHNSETEQNLISTGTSFNRESESCRGFIKIYHTIFKKKNNYVKLAAIKQHADHDSKLTCYRTGCSSFNSHVTQNKL